MELSQAAMQTPEALPPDLTAEKVKLNEWSDLKCTRLNHKG